MSVVVFEKIEKVAVIKINRPEAMNALNADVLKAIDAAVDQAAADDEVQVLIFTGEGKAFVAGADIAQMSTMTEQEGYDFGVLGSQVFRKIEMLDKPSIAAINGFALENADFKSFFKIVNLSGQSSYDLLQNVYSPSNPKEQAISLALTLTKQFLVDKGACRVHGGGFAGTIQSYIPNEMFCDYKQMIESVFGTGSCVKLNVRAVGGYEFKIGG